MASGMYDGLNSCNCWDLEEYTSEVVVRCCTVVQYLLGELCVVLGFFLVEPNWDDVAQKTRGGGDQKQGSG